MKPRIAIDLDCMLGETIIHELSNEILGFRIRPGCQALLESLRHHFTLCLWSTSNRWYVDEVLAFGLKSYFDETYAGDEIAGDWKDIRKISVLCLVDDNPYHRAAAEKEGITPDAYIVIPSFGSPDDQGDPSRWIQIIETALLRKPFGTREVL